MSRFVIVNGKVVEKEEINLSNLLLEERFGVVQQCWFGFGGIPLFEENVNQLKQQLEKLKIPVPALFQNQRELFRVTKRMLNKNKFYRSGFVHFRVFGHNEEPTSLITNEAFETFDFPFSENGVLVNYSPYPKHAINPLNPFRFYNQPLWDAAKAQLQNTPFQNSIFLNENHAVCDAIHTNLFFIRDKELIAPALSTGCYHDILRNIILKLATETDLTVTESDHIQQGDVLQMDEIFLAGEALGIQWILGVENKRYIHLYSLLIHEKLNQYLKTKVN